MMRRFPVLCFLAMLVLGSGRVGGQEGDPEKVVSRMEKQLAEAKTLQVTFEAEHTAGGKGDFGLFKGTLTVSEGNKVHLDGVFWNDGKPTDPWKVISDGTNLKSQGVYKASKPTPKRLADDYRSSLTHGGYLLVAFYLSSTAPKEAWPIFRASDVKLERKEEVGKRKAIVVVCKLTPTERAAFPGKDRVFSETLWIDVDTQLPMKRVVTYSMGGKKSTFTESYSTFDLAPKIEAKLFELP
jgi:outer membrane lipoprotein-sorting protein